jgi:hypothetical protein
MLGVEPIGDPIDEPIIDHQRAQERGLGLDILGSSAIRLASAA